MGEPVAVAELPPPIFDPTPDNPAFDWITPKPQPARIIPRWRKPALVGLAVAVVAAGGYAVVTHARKPTPTPLEQFLGVKPKEADGSKVVAEWHGFNETPQWFISPWFEVEPDWQYHYKVRGEVWFSILEPEKGKMTGQWRSDGLRIDELLAIVPLDYKQEPPMGSCYHVENEDTRSLFPRGKYRFRLFCKGAWKFSVHLLPRRID